MAKHEQNEDNKVKTAKNEANPSKLLGETSTSDDQIEPKDLKGVTNIVRKLSSAKQEGKAVLRAEPLERYVDKSKSLMSLRNSATVEERRSKFDRV